MSGFDFVNSDMFSLVSLTAAINEAGLPALAHCGDGPVRRAGHFDNDCRNRKRGMTLSLCLNTRGGNAQAVSSDKRTGVPIAAYTSPESASILADEAQNVRMFGRKTRQRLSSKFATASWRNAAEYRSYP